MDYGYYWSSTLRADKPNLVYYLICPGLTGDLTEYTPPVMWTRERRRGNSVRLVREAFEPGLSLGEVLASEAGDYKISTPVVVALKNADYAVITDGVDWLKVTAADALSESAVVEGVKGTLTYDAAGNPSLALSVCQPSAEPVTYQVAQLSLASCSEEELVGLESGQMVTFVGYYNASEGALRGHRVAPQGMSVTLSLDRVDPLEDGDYVEVTGVVSFKQAWDAAPSGAPRRVPRSGNDAFQNLTLDASSVVGAVYPTGITDVQDGSRTVVAVYDLRGAAVRQPQRGGVFIVRYSDGTAAKVKF